MATAPTKSRSATARPSRIRFVERSFDAADEKGFTPMNELPRKHPPRAGRRLRLSAECRAKSTTRTRPTARAGCAERQLRRGGIRVPPRWSIHAQDYLLAAAKHSATYSQFTR